MELQHLLCTIIRRMEHSGRRQHQSTYKNRQTVMSEPENRLLIEAVTYDALQVLEHFFHFEKTNRQGV